MDVQTQGEGPHWTLHQWTLYWDARRSATRDPAAHALGAAPGTAANAGAGDASAQAAATPRRAAPAEDEADSAAVRRKRSAEEEAAAQQLKGISAESKKRLLEVALPLAGTALEVRPGCHGMPAGRERGSVNPGLHAANPCSRVLCVRGTRPEPLTALLGGLCPLLRKLRTGCCAAHSSTRPAVPAGRGVAARRCARRRPGAAGVAGGRALAAHRGRHPGDEPRGRLHRLPSGGRRRLWWAPAGSPGLLGRLPACLPACLPVMLSARCSLRMVPSLTSRAANRVMPLRSQSGCTASPAGAAWRWCRPPLATWRRMPPGRPRLATRACSCPRTARVWCGWSWAQVGHEGGR